MKKIQLNHGFSLIELIVVVLCGTLITIAAFSTVLLGMRIHRNSLDTAQQQNEIRILHTLLQNLAGENNMDYYSQNSEKTGWCLTGSTQILYYNNSISIGDSVILDNVKFSSIKVQEDLITFTIILDSSDSYEFSIRFRGIEATSYAAPTQTSIVPASMLYSIRRPTVEQRRRDAVVSVARSQLGSNGQILLGSQTMSEYYSQWYTRTTVNQSWDTSTPWCACFLSWAVSQQAVGLPQGSIPLFANVNDGMLGFQGQTTGNGKSWSGSWQDAGYMPQAGDFIFFNLDSDPEPDHVGLVTGVNGDILYTLEGNVGSPSQVMALQYSVSDAAILGYGILNWE